LLVQSPNSSNSGVGQNSPDGQQQQMIRLVQPQLQGLQGVQMQGFQVAGIQGLQGLQGAISAQPQQQIITLPGKDRPY
jgi:hypothetical protein